MSVETTVLPTRRDERIDPRLRPALGLMTAAALSAPLWTILGLVIWSPT